MKTAVAPGPQSRQADATRNWKGGVTNVIVGVKDGGVLRVRLRRERESLGLLNGETRWRETQDFLDGTRSITHIGGTLTASSNDDRTIMANANNAISVRSKDVIDFGRLNSAIGELVRQMGATPDPTPEQQEAFVRGYQNVIAFMSEAQASMDRANGQVEVLSLSLRKSLGQL